MVARTLESVKAPFLACVRSSQPLPTLYLESCMLFINLPHSDELNFMSIDFSLAFEVSRVPCAEMFSHAFFTASNLLRMTIAPILGQDSFVFGEFNMMSTIQ